MNSIEGFNRDIADLTNLEHHNDLDEPSARREFKIFSPNSIISSLKRVNTRPEQKAKVADVREVPRAVVVDEKDALRTRERIGILIHENNSLMQESKEQADEINNLNHRLENSIRLVQNSTFEVDDSIDKVAGLQEQLNQAERDKKVGERRARLGAEESALKDSELESRDSLVKKKQREVDSAVERNEELNRVLADLTARYKDLIREATGASTRERELVEEMQSKEEDLESLNSKIVEHIRTNDELKRGLDTTSAINAAISKKIGAVDKREFELLERSQRNAVEIEEALYERDSALKKEKLLMKEIEILGQKCLEQPRLNKEKSELEIQKIRSDMAIMRRNFIVETAKLEEICTKLQTENERALREKKSAENELDKLLRSIPAESDRQIIVVEETHSRLRISERERVDAQQKLESMQQKVTRDHNQFNSERHHMNERQEISLLRIKRLEREVDNSKNESLELQKKISTVEGERKKHLDQIRNLIITQESQSKIMTTKYDSKVAEQNAKLESTSEAYASVNRDLKRVVLNHKGVGERFKEEADQIRHHYDQVTIKLKTDLVRSQSKVGEMDMTIQKAHGVRRDLNEQIDIEKRQHAQVYEKYIATQKQNELLSRQMSTMLAKEVVMIEERRKLNLEVDTLKVEKQKRHRPKQRSSEWNEGFNSTRQLQFDIERIQRRTGKGESD